MNPPYSFVHMLNVYSVSFGNQLGIVTNFVAQRIGKLLSVIEYLDLVSIEITRHAAGITNSRQSSRYDHSVIAGQDAP